MALKSYPLGEVAEINPRVKKSLQPTLECSFVPMDCIDEQYGKITHSYTRPVSEVLKGYTPFEENDVLLAKITPCMENGKAAIAKQLVNGIGFGTTEFHVLRAKESVLPEWLFYFIHRADFRKQAERRMTGSAGQKRVPEDFLEEVEIPLPSLDEQRRIAGILDQADRLRRLRRHARQQTDTFLQSVFIEMFGNPSHNPNNWPLETLEEYIEFLTSGSRGWAQYYCEQGDLFLRIQNIGKNELLLNDTAFVTAPDSAEAKRTTVQPRDLILSITADLGRTAVIPDNFGKAYINQHLALIRLKGLNPYYVASFMVSDYGRRQFEALDREGVKSGLNFDNVREFKILIPPKPLQDEFERLLVKFRHLQEQAWESERQAEMNFQALMHRAFSGQLLRSPALTGEPA